MVAEFIVLQSDSSNVAEIDRAARALAEGALVAFPTETVYGLAVNAAIDESVHRLRAIKDRGGKQPFTVHIGRRSDCQDFVPEPTAMGRRLIAKGWPGPLTLVFQVEDPSAARAHAGLGKAGAAAVYVENSVGVRYPDHPFAAGLLAAAEAPIIASSANLAGESPATKAEAIRERLGDKVDLIMDGGPTRYKKSSTIVALNGTGFRLLRPGVIDERTIRRLAAVTILFVCTGNTCRSPMAEGIFKQMISEMLGCNVADLPHRGIVVCSAGTLGVTGGGASKEAIQVCRERGIDISGHCSAGLTVDLIRPADYVYTMGHHHLDVVRSLAPRDADRAARLDPDEDIADPIGGTVDEYARVADRLEAALRRRMNEVSL